MAIYKELLQMDDFDPMCYIYCAACCFYMGMYKEAEEMASQVSEGWCASRCAVANLCEVTQSA